LANGRSDVELLAAWRAGDRKAGSALFKRHFTAVRRFCSATVEASAVEDLVQKTFVACVEKRDHIRENSGFKAYLFGIAHNLVRSHYRSRSRHELPVDFTERSFVDLSEGPSTFFARKRGQRVLLEALQRIPLDHQVILQLRYWEQFSAADLASFLDIPPASVTRRLRRARELLEAAIRRLDASPDVLLSTLRDLDDWANAVREQGAADPLRALGDLLPATLGARPLVARANLDDGATFSYRGGNSLAELRLGASVDEVEPDDAQPFAIQGFRGYWRWNEATRTASAMVRLGTTHLHLHVQPAVAGDVVLALLAELDLASLVQA
jgi:RNA polymerase sigma factor (sigma-70 family)